MAKTSTSIRKRSVKIAGHSTSISLEDAFWQALKRVAAAESKSLNALITKIDAAREGGDNAGNGGGGGNLSSALRVYVLEHLEKQTDNQL